MVIDKPAGFHVHRPESQREKVPRHKIILHQLRDQVGTRVYPLHRLDVSTSGILAFALHPEAARFCGRQFQAHMVEKKYWTVVRGFLPDEGQIDIPLELDSTGVPVPSLTRYRTLKRLELPVAVGKRHSSARYSWLEVSPRTGRYHQIRRHMARISHPVLGDATHGDSRHNRFFREKLGIQGLCLRSVGLKLLSLENETPLEFVAPSHAKWEKISELFSSPVVPE